MESERRRREQRRLILAQVARAATHSVAAHGGHVRPGGCIFKVDTGFGVGGTIKASDVARAQRLRSEFLKGCSLAAAFSFQNMLWTPPKIAAPSDLLEPSDLLLLSSAGAGNLPRQRVDCSLGQSWK